VKNKYNSNPGIKCEKCKGPIIVREKMVIEDEDRCNSCINGFYKLFSVTVPLFVIILVTLSRSLEEYGPLMFLTIFLVLPFAFVPLISVFKCRPSIPCCVMRSNDVCYSIMSLVIAYAISLALVFSAHILGGLINLSLFNKDTFFTFKSALTGLLLYYVIVVGIGIIMFLITLVGYFIIGPVHYEQEFGQGKSPTLECQDEYSEETTLL
jgi:hypothetical protein